MEDAELQSWFEDLITLGMPMEDGEEGAVPHVATPGFELRSNLAQFVATIIWTTTARNSYLLSHLFDVHGHPVVRPLKLHVPPPLIPGQETSEETLRQALPDVKDESEVVTVAWLIQRGLAARGTALVDFENPLVSSEAEKEVLQRFHERLLEVQRKISLRNTFRNVPYR